MPNRPALLTALTAVACAILIALGSWQLARKGEKEALIAAVEARARGAAQALPPAAEWPRLDLGRLDYQRVRLDGRFRPGAEAHVYGIASDPRTRSPQPGWFVYAPFELAGGGVVLVNRGFAPVDRKAPATRPEPPLGAPVAIEGLVRAPEERGLFRPVDDPAANVFHTRDPAALARALGVPAAPFTVDQATPNPAELPRAGLTRLVFPNRHLEYALTWFGLAATLVGVWGAFMWRNRPGPGRRRVTESGNGVRL
jgi:surfeit locus 1 family protein